MLTLLLLGQTGSADAVLRRFDQFMAKAPAFSVSVSSSVNGHHLAETVFRIQRPKRMSIVAKFAHTEGVFNLNESEGIEVFRSATLYALHPAVGKLYMPPFKMLNPLIHTVPTALYQGNSKTLFASGLRPKYAGKATINGVQTDVLSGYMKGDNSELNMKFWIDPSGKILKTYLKSVSMQGTFILEQSLSKYVLNPTFSSATFSTQLPLGYSPFALARFPDVNPSGEPMPTVTLRSVSGRVGTLKSIAEGKNLLLVVCNPGFHANSELIRAMPTVAKRVPDSKVVYATDRRDAASAKSLNAGDVYFDPTGKELTKLALPGTPTVYLIDKKGNLIQMFVGFDGTWDGLDEAVARLKGSGQGN
ncbi:MAG TPA: DUF2092 domain-containing protein [Fimbriimonadaceae bacterium]|nr:DUF2092 domain-containing protein [Fimbriimonadaceae bacterium]